MQEYSRRFASEYPPELWREPGVTENTDYSCVSSLSQQKSAIALVTSENYYQEFKATGAMSSYLPHSFVFWLCNLLHLSLRIVISKTVSIWLHKALNPKFTKSAFRVQHFVRGNSEAFKWKLLLKSNLNCCSAYKFSDDLGSSGSKFLNKYCNYVFCW